MQINERKRRNEELDDGLLAYYKRIETRENLPSWQNQVKVETREFYLVTLFTFGLTMTGICLELQNFILIFLFLVSVFSDPQRGALLGRSPGRGLTILRCESHPPLCVGLVWTVDLSADVIEFREFFKINVMKSVGKQIKIIKKTIKINQKYGTDDEKTREQKKTRTKMYIKGSRIQTIP